MNDFDGFCEDLYEQAKRFYELARESKTEEGKKAFINGSLLLGMCALEAYVNGIAEEMFLADGYSLHVKSALLERDVKLKDGEFVLTDTLKMSKLIDRIEILYRTHAQKSLPSGEQWCINLKRAISLRNQVVHPKDAVILDLATLEVFLRAINSCLSLLYKAVYKRDFPRAGADLNSKLTFLS